MEHLILMGKRLREIRETYILPGVRLSSSQFAKMLNSTSDKILNYEKGLSNLPNILLISLYRLGINPTYILTGEGSVYAENEEGINLSKKYIFNKETVSINLVERKHITSISDEDIPIVTAAAMDLRKKYHKKKDNK